MSEITKAKELDVRALLKRVIDPELMVNIVDLGLVYGVFIEENPAQITIDLTLTSQGCPLGDVIIENVKQLLAKHYIQYEIEVNLVWDPAWSTEYITQEGKLALSSL